MNYKFITKRDEDTDIEWRRKNRIELNRIIDAYNNWQIEDNRNLNKIERVLALIEYGKQTLPDDYHEELNDMKKYIDKWKGFNF